GEQGVLVMLEADDIEKKDRPYTFWLYDRNLNLVWTTRHLVPFKFEFSNFYKSGNSYYFLFQRSEQELAVLSVSLDDGKGRLLEFDNIVKANIAQFAVLKDQIYLGGELRNKPFVVHFDPQNSFAKVLPAIQQIDTYLANITVDSIYNDRVLIVLGSRKPRQKLVFFNEYNLRGQLERSFTIENNIDYQLLDFKPYPKNGTEWLIFGAYAYKNWDKVQGIYVVNLVDPQKEPAIYPYDLANFKNYFNFYRDKKKDRILNQVAEAKASGKRKRYSYDWFIHDLQFQNDLIYFSVDVYRPDYEVRNRGSRGYYDPYRYSSFYSPYDIRSIFGYYYRYDPFAQARSPQNRRLPSDYDYRSTFVCAFTGQGKPVLDNTFDLNNRSQRIPSRPTAFHHAGDSLAFFEFEEGEARYQRMYRSEERDPETITSDRNWERTETDSLQVGARENENLSFWYDDHFILSGYQRLRGGGMDNRKVFYLSKIRYAAKTEEE
ncbi:MAG: hypothetical protein AAF740_14040, partial [Bacteroidota bacterium]